MAVVVARVVVVVAVGIAALVVVVVVVTVVAVVVVVGIVGKASTVTEGTEEWAIASTVDPSATCRRCDLSTRGRLVGAALRMRLVAITRRKQSDPRWTDQPVWWSRCICSCNPYQT